MLTNWKAVLFCLAVAVLLGSTAAATTINFGTPAGATLAGLPVNAFATFSTGAGELTVILQNLESDPTSVIQNLSDVYFVLSTGQTTGILTSSSALERTVAADGSFTDGAVVSTGWGLQNNISGGLRLCLLSGCGVAPTHTLIGGPDSSNLYSSANSSIAGNPAHNPFLVGPATFHLSIPGVTDATTITSVIFSFGTTEGQNVPGGNVPEPASLLLLGSGLVLLGPGRLKRKTRG